MITVKHKIIQLLEDTSRPLAPLEIAQNLKANRNTVRARLSELRKKGMVLRVFKHHYTITTTHGVVPPRVQNLQVKAGVPVRVEHRGPPGSGYKESVIKMGDLSVILQFGYRNQQVNYQVSTPRGLDLDGFRAVHVAVGKHLQVMGYKSPSPDDWMVIEYELLFGHSSVKMEGVKALTWRALDGSLEKYYNKDSGLRREIRPTTELPVRDLEHLLQGGMAQYQVTQGLSLIAKMVGDSIKSQKNTNRLVSDLTKVVGALANAQIRMQDSISEFLDKFKEDTK